jgi:hypothetical protein
MSVVDGDDGIPLAALAPLAAWLALWNVLGVYTFGHGPLSFACLAAIGALTAAATPLTRRLAAWRRLVVPRRAVVAILAAVVLAAVVGHARMLERGVGSGRMIDIGRNTLCAGRRFFDDGVDPYAVRCHADDDATPIAGAPHVTYVRGELRMFGVPYAYGYPYFPAMFLSFEPFRQADRGLDAIRYGNACWLLLSVVGAFWLAVRLAPARAGPLAGWLAAAAIVPIWGLAFDLFRAGVTDLVIGVYLLGGLIAWTYRRPLVAGLGVGLAWAAKLLPGGLVVFALAVWSVRARPAARAGPAARAWLWLGVAGAMAVVVLPFAVWLPGEFLSSTILYFLTARAGGDDSSLWYVLPGGLQTPFLVVGGAVVLAVVAAGVARRGATIGDLTRTTFLGYVAFVAFNKMIHLNYLWAVLPLGAAALAAAMAGALEPTGDDGAGR